MASPTIEFVGIHPFELGGIKSIEFKRHLGEPETIYAEIWGTTKEKDRWRVLTTIPGSEIVVRIPSLSKQIRVAREALLMGAERPSPEVKPFSSMSAERQVKLVRRSNQRGPIQLQIGYDPKEQEVCSLRFRNLS